MSLGIDEIFFGTSGLLIILPIFNFVIISFKLNAHNIPLQVMRIIRYIYGTR